MNFHQDRLALVQEFDNINTIALSSSVEGIVEADWLIIMRQLGPLCVELRT